MPEAPPTRPSLLIRLRDHQDHAAWSQFVDVYAPLIYGYLRKRGLQDADSADLTQICLRQVAAHVGSLEYDPRRDSFRGWLFTIVRNRLRNFCAQPRHLHQGTGDSGVQRLLENQAAPEPDEAREWGREYQAGLFAWAAEQVRPLVQEATWLAFWQTAVEGKSGQEVARGLGLTVAAVYLAKGRVVARLRALIREVQDEL
jgi:RNA polymerase sigma factor (sigma-70 family)